MSAEYWTAKFLFQRALGLTYIIAFTVALRQFKPLIGERGIMPFTDFVEKAEFSRKPSLFHFQPLKSDQAMKLTAYLGLFLSITAFTGVSELFGTAVSMIIWGLLYILYLSFVNVGQTFWSFGWESMLVEAGFLAIFLGPINTAAPFLIILLLRWMLFRVEFGAGLIKIRGDQCWRDLTCMNHHYETQPMPNSVSYYLDKMPEWFHRIETAGNHFTQLIVPFLYFAPQPFAAIAGLLTIVTQLWLMIGGNYAFLNFLTIVLAFSTFSDATLGFLPLPEVAANPLTTPHQAAVYIVFLGFIALSYWPVKNMLSSDQKMNAGFNPLHLANTYGAFGSVTKERREVVIEATDKENLAEADWKEYEFYGKPSDPSERPPQIAPYHLRLDWQMWFVPLSPYQRKWFDRFIHKLAETDEKTHKLLKKVPFDNPEYIRARMYRYKFKSREEKKQTGKWWKRELIDEYYPPLKAEN